MKTRRPQRGAAAVELGLVLALVLVPLTLGVIDVGRAIYQYDTLTKGVRDGARFLTTVTPATQTLAARCLAITAEPTNNGTSCSGTPIVPGLQLGHASVCDRVLCNNTHNLVPVTVGGTQRGVAHLVSVTISGLQFQSITGAVIDFPFGAVSATFAVKA